jgi:16S rRNA (adenine1518-N6/adenine1519-N6)-dimethyltransferase
VSAARKRPPQGGTEPRPLSRPKKRFGQHFLISPRIIDGILRLAALLPQDRVVEIGAGTGNLTEALARRAGHVMALELDRDLIPTLRQRFADQPQVDIIHADALSFDFMLLPAPFIVVANLPYGSAIAILTRLLALRCHMRHAVIMLQHEVAERLCAVPGTKAYGSLTLLTQWFASIDRGFNVPPSAFSPPPKVRSRVVRVRPHATPRVAVPDEAFLFRVIRAAFSQRRKMLANALQQEFHALAPQALRHAIETSAIATTRRGESLSLDEFARLSEALQQVLAVPQE